VSFVQRPLNLLRSRAAIGTIQALSVVLALLVILPLALYAPPLALVFAGGLITLMITAAVGLEHTGSFFLVAAITAAPLNAVRPVPGLNFVTLSDLFLAVGLIMLVPHFAGTRLQIPSAFVLGAAGIFAIGSLASIASGTALLSFNHMLRFAVGAVVLAVLICWWSPSMKTVVAAISGYVFGNVISVVYGLIHGVPPGGRHIGLSTHANVMGLCDALAVSLIPFLFATVRRERRWLVVAGAVVCTYGIWITGSRGALLTSMAILVLYPVITRSLSFGLVVVALGFLAPLGISQIADRVSDTSALGRLLGKGSSSYADQAREDAARVAIDQFTAHPLLGGGFGTVLSAHNIFLQLAAAAGILGLVFFLVVLWSLIRPLLSIPSPYGLLSVPALAYAMAGLLFPFLWDRYIWCILAFALVGPILAQRAAEEGEPVAPEPVEHRARERL